MEIGYIIITMAMYGHPASREISGPIVRMVIGYIQDMAGPGFPNTAGDGPLFTMVAGSVIVTTDGFGFPIRNGRQPGLPGEVHRVILDGHRWVRA